MDRILYFLIGGCVGGAIVFAFPEKVEVGKIGTTDLALAVSLLVGFAAACLVLIYTPWGRASRLRFETKVADEDKRIRESGQVRPPLGP